MKILIKEIIGWIFFAGGIGFILWVWVSLLLFSESPDSSSAFMPPPVIIALVFTVFALFWVGLGFFTLREARKQKKNL